VPAPPIYLYSVNREKYLLQGEVWEEVFASEEACTTFNLFKNTFIYYFNRAFPLKTTEVKGTILNKWITGGLIRSRNKLRLLNHIKRTTKLSSESLQYIQNYQLIFRKVVRGARMKESERFVSSAKNQTKAMWKLINKETGNSQSNSDYTIKSGNELITSPQVVSDRFNTFFVEVIEDLLLQKNVLDQKKNRQFFVKECSKTMFYPQ
jgi:hypothetical protein